MSETAVNSDDPEVDRKTGEVEEIAHEPNTPSENNRWFAYGNNTVGGVGCPVKKSSIDVAPEDTDAVQKYDRQITNPKAHHGLTDETTARTAWLDAIAELEAHHEFLRDSNMTDQAKDRKQSLTTARKVARDLGWIENNNE